MTIVAILGRPNVGKSTLYNRLIGKKHALVDDQPGVTRDRRVGRASLAELEFDVVDTAGLEQAKEGTLEARMRAASLEALAMADVVLIVIDGRAGLTPEDEAIVRAARKSKAKLILVVNKAEGNKASTAIAECFRLGLGEPVAISAEHGEGMVELYDALAPHINTQEPMSEPPHLQIALVGRPNVGKSTLLNRLIGEERVLTGPEAGITRDAIAVDLSVDGKPIRLIDTAGMRRKARVQAKVESLAVSDTIHTIKFAQVVVVVMDATEPLEKQDNLIASLVSDEGRAMVIAMNKWDEVPDSKAYLEAMHQRIAHVLPQVKGVPIVPISAKRGTHINKLLRACFVAYDVWNKEITTGALNRWLEDALEAYTPPLVAGRRIKIRYMTQTSTRPPSFALFANTKEIPDHYTRYLQNGLREMFGLSGVPIRLTIKKNKNPYAKEQDT